MSRSTRRHPIVGYGKSEKQDKALAHRKLRRIVTQQLQARADTEVLPAYRELANVRRWAKDPRAWCAETCKVMPKLLRK
jgi:hypothetical protein